MMNFMNAGGFSMWIVLALNIAIVTAAVLFARQPRADKLPLLRKLAIANLFMILGGVATNVAATFRNVAAMYDSLKLSEVPAYIMVGLSESLAPAVLGFTVLGLAYIVIAWGMRNLPANP